MNEQVRERHGELYVFFMWSCSKRYLALFDSLPMCRARIRPFIERVIDNTSPSSSSTFHNDSHTMANYSNYYSRSPPPLQHPVPTHPAFIPEPPSTPGPGPASPQGYQRYQQQPAPHHVPDFAAWGMNDTTAQFGMQLGQSAVAAGQEYVQKNVSQLLLSPTPR